MEFLCLEFINTQWYNKHKPVEERLRNYKWLTEFCSKWSIGQIDFNEETSAKLIKFRNNLFQIILQVCREKELTSKNINKLNKYLKMGKCQQILSYENGEYNFKMVPQTSNLNYMIYKIALSCAEMLATKPLEYLKECSNPDCDWIFYDDSKNHSRKWCDNKCASLMKVRKYRASRKI